MLLLDPTAQTSSANDATEENGTEQQPMDTNDVEGDEDSESERVGSVDSKHSEIENGSLNDSSVLPTESNSKNTVDSGTKRPSTGKISVKAKIGDRSTSSSETMPTLESLEPETNG
jgi:hypothetical protein